MMCGRMVLGEIVSIVLGAWFPENVELALIYTIAHPVKTHVNGFGALDFYVIVGNSCSCGVVDLDWSCWLGMPHFS